MTALGRGVSYARIFTTREMLITPAELADALTGRGFVAGLTDAAGTSAALSEAGLADARFEEGAEGYRIVSLSSSKGFGCLVKVQVASSDDLPDDETARRAVRKPRRVYLLEGGGPGNSDRNLCENIAESLMILTDGVVEIGGLGVKGNRPSIHTSRWIGEVRG